MLLLLRLLERTPCAIDDAKDDDDEDDNEDEDEDGRKLNDLEKEEPAFAEKSNTYSLTTAPWQHETRSTFLRKGLYPLYSKHHMFWSQPPSTYTFFSRATRYLRLIFYNLEFFVCVLKLLTGILRALRVAARHAKDISTTMLR